MQSSETEPPTTNEDGRLLLEILREDVAARVLSDDHAMIAAIDRGIAAAVSAIYPPERPATGGVLDPDDAARVALAVWPAAEGFVAEELAHPGHVPTPASRGPVVADLSLRQLLRHALGRADR
jgi:hypothetical protein